MTTTVWATYIVSDFVINEDRSWENKSKHYNTRPFENIDNLIEHLIKEQQKQQIQVTMIVKNDKMIWQSEYPIDFTWLKLT